MNSRVIERRLRPDRFSQTGVVLAPDQANRVAPASPLTLDFSLTRAALGLAIGSLLLAGCFSLLLVVGRIPALAQWVTDPQFFKRCLVLHVDLALLVWFFAFAAALYSLLPGCRASHTTYRNG